MAILKICGRCQSTIDCHVNDIDNCPCSKVMVSTKLNEFLTLTQYDCLCNPCLNTLNVLVNKACTDVETGENDDDYYMEGHLFVFSEIYHIKRGYCCKSNCRHCAYGFKAI